MFSGSSLQKKPKFISNEKLSKQLLEEIDKSTDLGAFSEKKFSALLNKAEKKGYDLDDSVDFEGMNLLHHSCEKGNEKAVKILLDKGVRIEATDDDTRTALSHAARSKNSKKTINLLLDRGAKIEERDKWLMTPLAHACHNKYNEKAVKLLLDKGANLDARDKWKKPPLAHACINNNKETINLLLNTSKVKKDHIKKSLNVTGSEEIKKILTEKLERLEEGDKSLNIPHKSKNNGNLAKQILIEQAKKAK